LSAFLRFTRPRSFVQSQRRVTPASDPNDDDLVWSQLSVSDLTDLGRAAAGIAQQLMSEHFRNLQLVFCCL